MKRNDQLTPPLKWHGGKSYLADWIIDRMPPHLHYVEPFAGGLAVLLAKNPLDLRHQWSDKSSEKGHSEVVNDLNQELMNFWQVENCRLIPICWRERLLSLPTGVISPKKSTGLVHT